MEFYDFIRTQISISRKTFQNSNLSPLLCPFNFIHVLQVAIDLSQNWRKLLCFARDVSRSTIFVSDSCTVSLSPSTPPPSPVHGPFTLQPRVTLLHANFIADDAESPESLSWILIISGVALARLSTGVE